MTPTRRRPGRKSAADLMTPAAFGLTVPRQKPPPELTGEECEIFYMVTAAMPADWLSTASLPLLMQLCRHSIQARRLSELVEHAAGNRETELTYYASLLQLQRGESAAIGSLSSKLRLNPAALRNDRGHLQHKRPGPPPWEMALAKWSEPEPPPPTPKPRRAKPV